MIHLHTSQRMNCRDHLGANSWQGSLYKSSPAQSQSGRHAPAAQPSCALRPPPAALLLKAGSRHVRLCSPRSARCHLLQGEQQRSLTECADPRIGILRSMCSLPALLLAKPLHELLGVDLTTTILIHLKYKHGYRWRISSRLEEVRKEGTAYPGHYGIGCNR